MRLEPRGFAAENANTARARRLEAHDGIAERGLAHAVTADDGKDPTIERHRDALNGMALTVIDVQILDLERGLAFSHGALRGRLPAPRDRLRFAPASPL